MPLLRPCRVLLIVECRHFEFIGVKG
jgi:hypothetical protein